jgi:hypothetical protein
MVDPIDAADGVMFEGQRLRVEMSKGSAEALGVSTGGYDDRYHRIPCPLQNLSRYRGVHSLTDEGRARW